MFRDGSGAFHKVWHKARFPQMRHVAEHSSHCEIGFCSQQLARLLTWSGTEDAFRTHCKHEANSDTQICFPIIAMHPTHPNTASIPLSANSVHIPTQLCISMARSSCAVAEIRTYALRALAQNQTPQEFNVPHQRVTLATHA